MNIFHCCVQKTASQWFRRIFHDSRILELSGLQPYNFYQELEKEDPRLSSSYVFTEQFPSNTIITPLYISFESFCTIPKNEDYRAFFVMRDPRDLIVSWYFSTRYSHPSIGKIQEHRDKLNQVSIKEGLMLSIDFLLDRGYFLTLESWINAAAVDPNVRLVKYEDITSSDNFGAMEDLFRHCMIHARTDVLQAVLDDVRFEKLAERKQGIEDQFSHYRKGIEGDWVNYFDDEVESKFNEELGDLTAALGYRTTKVDLLKKQLAQTQLYLQKALLDIQELQQQCLKNGLERPRQFEQANEVLELTEMSMFWRFRSQWTRLKKHLSLLR